MRRTSRHGANRGVSLIETMISMGILMVILFGITLLGTSVSRVNDRQQIEGSMTSGARASLDEILYQIRSADNLLSTWTNNGTTYATGTSQMAFTAPAYNPGTSSVFVTGASDSLLLQYDSTNKRLREVCLPATGSTRPTRPNYTLADNVAAFTLTYRAREVFTATATGTTTYTLGVPAAGTPTVLVDGTPVTCTFNSTTRVVTITNTPAIGSEVQVSYEVFLGLNNVNAATVLPQVTEIDVTMSIEEKDGRDTVRTVTLSGSARLHNRRL